MHLEFCEGQPDPKTKKLFQNGFRLICKRLGIDGYNAQINLDFIKPHNEPSRPDAIAGGCIYPDGFDSIRRVKSGKQPKCFRIQIAPDTLGMMMAAFCHEMIHVRQWLTGMLQAGWNFHTDQVLQLFHGVPVSEQKIAYEDQPWEVEAHAEMYPLALWVASEIAKEIKCHAEKTDRCSL